MKQISCLSKLVCVLKYFFDSRRLNVFMHSCVFLFLIRYIMRYLLNKDTSSLKRSPKQLFSLNIYCSLCYSRKDSNYLSSKGAAGYLVQKYAFPYLDCKLFCLTFSIATSQVHLSSLHYECICLIQSSSSSGKKQLANAYAAQCLDKLLSFSSLTTAIKKSLRIGSFSSFSCPSVYKISCERSTDYEM